VYKYRALKTCWQKIVHFIPSHFASSNICSNWQGSVTICVENCEDETLRFNATDWEAASQNANIRQLDWVPDTFFPHTN